LGKIRKGVGCVGHKSDNNITICLMTDFTMHSTRLLVPGHLTFPRAAAVYCDESGNSGPNYLDPAQPFYVLAGWLVPDERIVEVNVVIEAFRTTHFEQRNELKATAVLRNEATKGKCVTLFRSLAELHCVPMFLIAEKRYCVAAKLVETFLDPAYNHMVRNGFTGDFITKQEIANSLYERLPDGVLRQFAEAYRAPDARALGTALRQVGSAVEEHISPELAKAIAGSASFIDEIAEIEAATSPLGNVSGTLNMPCLISFLMLVENLGRMGIAQPITVLHDQQHAYQEGYKRVYDLHRGMADWIRRFPHTDATYSNLRHVAKFEMRESKETLPIQAADLLAGAIHHCCRLATSETVVTDGDFALAEAVFPALFVPTPRLTSLVCSDAFLRAIGRRVFKPNIKGSSQDHADADRNLEATLGPMFPVKRSPSDATPSEPKVPLDLPLFGLLGVERKSLLILDDPGATDEMFQRILVLFTSADKAKLFLERCSLDRLAESQRLVEFDPSAPERLVELLREASEHARTVAVDPDDRPRKCVRVSEMIVNLSAILDRMRRIFTSGLDSVLLERHTVSSTEVLTMQCRDGRYAALSSPRGTISFGATRREALDKFCAANGLTPSCEQGEST